MCGACDVCVACVVFVCVVLWCVCVCGACLCALCVAQDLCVVNIAFQICEFEFCVEIMYKRSRETGARDHGYGDTKCRLWRPRPRAGGVRRDFRIIVKRVHEATGMGTLSADLGSRDLGREAPDGISVL